MWTFACLLLLVAAGAHAQLQFRVIKEWRYVNYTWRSEEELRAATASGSYDPERCVMSGLGYYAGFYYVATPRMHDAPATLTRIPELGSPSPLLEPFPSWRANRVGDCDALQNVQNVQVDAAGGLYVIDSGRTNTAGQRSNNLCPAKLVKFDLKARPAGDELATEVYRYEFPASVASHQVNYLYDLVLDDHYVYISDNSAQDPGLIVFSELTMTSWKIRHGTFKADQNASTVNVSGVVLQTELNLAGLALGPQMDDGRLLYYTPLSSFSLFAVNTNELRQPNAVTLKNVRLIGRKSSQTDGMLMDDKGVLYFGQLATSSIARWDTNRTSYRPKLIAQDPNYVQWPNSFTFNDAGDLVVLCNTLAKFVTHRVDLNEPNFRLLAGNVSAQSYVRNRFRYDESAGHVHFHPATPNTTQTYSEENSSMGNGDVNDLLIDDNLDSGPSSIALSRGPSLLAILTCTLMLQV